jgi:serine protease Do
MSVSTNQLVASVVAKARKVAAPAAVAGAFVLGAALFVGRGGVHAATPLAGPMDDDSVSALTSLDRAMEAVASRVTPAVVNVEVTARGRGGQFTINGQTPDDGEMQNLPPGMRQFFGPMFQMPQQPQIEHGVGSGVIVSPDGYIVTNDHVVDGATEIEVKLNDRRELKGKVIGVDKLTDLAVIKVDASNLPTVVWGDSSKLMPGQTVLAFGSPFGYFQFSVTRGIVSAVNRPNPYSDDARKPGGYIQTDAAINPGNSGGPLVNAHGELVGINTFIISNSGSFAGAGFAIPSQLVHATADQLIKTGKVSHGYLGISMNDVTPSNAHFFNLQQPEGAIVAQVTADSPASRGGVKTGDVIDKLNGEKIVNGSALQTAVSEMTPGTKITLGVIRDGKAETLNLTVGEFHGNGKEEASIDSEGGQQKGRLGLAVADLTADLRRQANVPDEVHGVIVEQVRPGSAAEDAGIQPGDVILEVNRKPAQSADQFANAVHQSPEGKDVLLLVWSRGNATYRTIHSDQNDQNG